MSNPAWDNILIHTKLHRPTIPDDMVPRPHLTDWLDQHWQQRLLLVSAPAGYGKSTLISSWVMGLEMPSAWVSMDESDNDLGVFLAYLIAAIQSISPKTLIEMQALLQAPELPPLRYLSSVLINELNAISGDYFLVLDDYHLIHEITIHNLLDELLRFPPRGLHLVIGTRTDPLLSLVELRARGQMAEIRGQDLRFSLEETKKLMHNLLGKEIEEGTALALEQRSEGWVTGLRLAALALRHRKGQLSIDGELSANNHFVRDYLTSEILKSQVATFSESLMKISILDRFCAGLCQAICVAEVKTGDVQFEAAEFMEYLYASNLFIILLDDGSQWVRFHHLFKDFLNEQLERRFTQEEIALLHTRASAWFAQNGLIDEAINHALHAGDLLGAAQVVEQNVRKVLDNDHWHLLENWMKRLPENIINERPKLMLAKAWVSFHKFTLQDIPPILETAETILDNDAASQSLWGEVDFFWGHHWYWQGQSARSLELLGRALERIPKEHYLARGEAELFWGISSQMSGQKEESVLKLNQWLFNDQSPHPGRHTKLLGSLIFCHLLSGELMEAAYVTQRVQDMVKDDNNLYLNAWASYLDGNIHYAWNDLENAARCFDFAVKNRYVLHTAAAVDSLAGLALTCQALGQPNSANAAMAQLHDFTQEINSPAYFTVACSCQARLSLLQGDLASALRWIKMADLNTDRGVMFYWLEIPRLTQCRVLIAEATSTSLKEAAQKLQTYEQQNIAEHNTHQLIDVLLLQSLALQKQSQTDLALAALARAITLAETGGWIRPFVEPGPELAELLARLVDRQGATKYTHKILAACNSEHFSEVSLSSAPSSQLIEPLTNREFEVLELLEKRLTNKEVAAELHISVGTVQQHLNHIYAKLNVKGRRQAITKAKALALFPVPN